MMKFHNQEYVYSTAKETFGVVIGYRGGKYIIKDDDGHTHAADERQLRHTRRQYRGRR